MLVETNFTEVTEIAGDEVAQHQIERSVHRYTWVSDFCNDMDVLEIACGSGQGADLLASEATSYVGIDCCAELINKAKSINPQLSFFEGNACQLPFNDSSKDIIIFFEAIYYVKDIDQLFKEFNRVLRDDGKIFITSTNKDLFDFHKSNYSHRYFGANEFESLVDNYNMSVEIFGYDDLSKLSFFAKMVRIIKYLADQLCLIPTTMNGKKWLKKIIYGKLVYMPNKLSNSLTSCSKNRDLYVIPKDKKDVKHAYIYTIITKK